jgi:hypothetical protein
MRVMLGAMGWAAILLAGCKPAPVKPATSTDLAFPVVVLFSNSAALLYQRADELTKMHVNYVTGSDAAPTLVDSRFTIYSMAQLQSTHGGMWLMAHPSGTTEVTFELQRQAETGRAAALALFRQQLDKQSWRTDLDAARGNLSAQPTVESMFAALQASGESTPTQP